MTVEGPLRIEPGFQGAKPMRRSYARWAIIAAAFF
jgi:hypothetical protein